MNLREPLLTEEKGQFSEWLTHVGGHMPHNSSHVKQQPSPPSTAPPYKLSPRNRPSSQERISFDKSSLSNRRETAVVRAARASTRRRTESGNTLDEMMRDCSPPCPGSPVASTGLKVRAKKLKKIRTRSQSPTVSLAARRSAHSPTRKRTASATSTSSLTSNDAAATAVVVATAATTSMSTSMSTSDDLYTFKDRRADDDGDVMSSLRTLQQNLQVFRLSRRDTSFTTTTTTTPHMRKDQFLRNVITSNNAMNVSIRTIMLKHLMQLYRAIKHPELGKNSAEKRRMKEERKTRRKYI